MFNLICLLVVSTCIVATYLKTFRDARVAIGTWASDQDATIQNVKLAVFGSPFWYKNGVTCIVTLGFERGGSRKAWVYWPAWSMLGDTMRVRWMEK